MSNVHTNSAPLPSPSCFNFSPRYFCRCPWRYCHAKGQGGGWKSQSWPCGHAACMSQSSPPSSTSAPDPSCSTGGYWRLDGFLIVKLLACYLCNYWYFQGGGFVSLDRTEKWILMLWLTTWTEYSVLATVSLRRGVGKLTAIVNDWGWTEPFARFLLLKRQTCVLWTKCKQSALRKSYNMRNWYILHIQNY